MATSESVQIQNSKNPDPPPPPNVRPCMKPWKQFSPVPYYFILGTSLISRTQPRLLRRATAWVCSLALEYVIGKPLTEQHAVVCKHCLSSYGTHAPKCLDYLWEKTSWLAYMPQRKLRDMHMQMLSSGIPYSTGFGLKPCKVRIVQLIDSRFLYQCADMLCTSAIDTIFTILHTGWACHSQC